MATKKKTKKTVEKLLKMKKVDNWGATGVLYEQAKKSQDPVLIRAVNKIIKIKATQTTKGKKKVPTRAKRSAKKTPKEEKKNKDIIISSPVDPTIQVIVASEMADDDLIENELNGKIMPYFIYQFCENKPACKPEVVSAGQCPHKKTTGMSVKGVNEVVRLLNKNSASGTKIRMNPSFLRIERDINHNGEKGVEVSVFAENLVDGNSAWGVKFEPYMKIRKGRMVNKKWVPPTEYKNTFAVEKALSKAERNAKRKLIPEVLAIKSIEQLIKSNPECVKQIAPVQYEVEKITKVKPVPSTTEEIEKMIRNAVMQAKSIEVLFDLDEKILASKDFKTSFKKEMHKIISKMIKEIEKK